jgi:hypothetical protein
VYVNWVGLLVGLVVGIACVVAFFRWHHLVNWRKVNQWKLALAVPFGTVTIGMSWPEFEKGIVGAIALTFILSWITEIGTEMAAWRADEDSPDEGD